MLTVKQIGVQLKSLVFSITLCSSWGVAALEYQEAYPVSGSTAQELIDNMGDNTHVPAGAFGYTKLETRMNWVSFVNTDGLCELESVDFDYDITIYMPEWLDKYTAKQCLQDSWDNVWADIQLHEERHRDLFRLLNPTNIEQQLSTITPQTSCSILKETINEELAVILARNEQLHTQFHRSNTPPTLWDC